MNLESLELCDKRIAMQEMATRTRGAEISRFDKRAGPVARDEVEETDRKIDARPKTTKDP